MISEWILIFYLAATPGGEPPVSIDRVGEFASMEACTRAGAAIRERFGEFGSNTGFDCIQTSTGRTAVDVMAQERLNHSQNR